MRVALSLFTCLFVATGLVACTDASAVDESGESGTGEGGELGEGGESGHGGESGDTGWDPQDAVDEAIEEIPTYLELHDRVIARTCSPDEGVCHHAKEYPDLTTPQSMLAVAGAGCNLAVEDPMNTFDGCEVHGDRIVMLWGGNDLFTTEVAYIEYEPSELAPGNTDVLVHLRDPMPEAMDSAELESMRFERDYPDEPTLELMYFWSQVHYEQGESVLRIVGYELSGDIEVQFIDDGLKLGDPNQNGTFGADEGTWDLIALGDPERSYLMGRLRGSVPGTPMPLANEPLSSAEMIALSCWIEGLSVDGAIDVYAPIAYEGCQAAEDFGQPDESSGHDFAVDVQPIFQRCLGGGCHSGAIPAASLDLSPDVARAELLKPASQDPETPRVVPGNPTASYLVHKLRGKGAVGLQMPRTAEGDGEPLSEEELAVVEAWISAGAPPPAG